MAHLNSTRQERRGWTVARILREGYAHMRFRKTVLADRVLTISMDGIVASADGLAVFLASLAAVPGCGGRQGDSIKAALMTEFRIQAEIAARAGDTSLAQQFASQIETLAPPRGSPAEAVQFHHSAMLEDICARLWRDAEEKRFIYLPKTLPAAAKTAAILACEERPADSADQSPFWAEDPERAASSEQPRGLILIDRQQVEVIRDRRGRYRALSEAAWQAQKAKLIKFCAALPVGVVVLVVDFAAAQLTASAIIGSGLVLPAPGGCIVAPRSACLSDIIAACEIAQDGAQDLPSLLST